MFVQNKNYLIWSSFVHLSNIPKLLYTSDCASPGFSFAGLRYMAPRKTEFWLFLAFFALFGQLFYAHIYPLTICDKSLQ